MVLTLNRAQNQSFLLLCDVAASIAASQTTASCNVTLQTTVRGLTPLLLRMKLL